MRWINFLWHSKRLCFILVFILIINSLLMFGCQVRQSSVQPSFTSSPVSSEDTSSITSSTDVNKNTALYDNKTVELTGQTYLTRSPPKLLLDGYGGVNITGNTSDFGKGFYHVKGIYDPGINTLNVSESTKEEPKYLAIEEGRKFDINLIPVEVQGLIATTPKEVANQLSAYLSIPNFPKDTPIYPYVVYSKDALYLVLSGTLIQMPAKFTLNEMAEKLIEPGESHKYFSNRSFEVRPHHNITL